MPDELYLPVFAAVALLYYLLCSLRPVRSERSDMPILVWREAFSTEWSDWIELEGVSPSADYTTTLTAVRDEAHAEATAVQFASVIHPSDAPAYTLRVLFMSAVREPAHDRDLVTAS